MLQQVPQTITTTELQRNPKILEKLNKNNDFRVIIRESEQVGVYSPVKLYNKLVHKVEELENDLAERNLQLAKAEIEIAKSSKKGLGSLKDADDILL